MKTSVAVGTIKGLFVLRFSEDRQTVQVEGPYLKGWKASSAARTAQGDYILATASFVYGASIHRSPDLRTWTHLEAGPRYPDGSECKLNEIWTLVTHGDRWFAGVDEAALFTSEDEGASWQLNEALAGHPTRSQWFPGFGGLCAHSILVDPNNPQRQWVGISAVGVFRSEDGGETWTPRNEGVPVIIEDKVHKDIGYCVHSIVADPEDSDRIYRQDHQGMYRTSNGGDSWEKIEDGLVSRFGFPLVQDRNTRALYACPLESDEYRMPVDGKLAVFSSGNGGDSWEALPRDGLPENLYAAVLRKAMSVDELDPCGIYFGTAAGTFHYSVDAGQTWETLPEILPRILTVHAFVEE